MTTAQAIKEMMNAWLVIESAAKLRFPNASAEEIYQISKSAMNAQLKK